MRHCHRRILHNIISLFLSFSNTERREVVFIGQYCSEREGGGYRCRWTSFPFYDGLLWLHSTDARKGDGFFLFQTITGAQVLFFFYFYNTFYHFFSTFTTRPSISSLLQRPTGHESRRFSCRCRIKKLFYFYFFHLIKLFNKYKKSNKIVNNEKRNRPLLWPLSISFNYQRIFWSCILLWISRIYLNVFLIFQHFNKMKAIKLAIWYKIINIA